MPLERYCRGQERFAGQCQSRWGLTWIAIHKRRSRRGLRTSRALAGRFRQYTIRENGKADTIASPHTKRRLGLPVVHARSHTSCSCGDPAPSFGSRWRHWTQPFGSTSDLLRRLQDDAGLRQLCGFETLPHRTTLGRLSHCLTILAPLSTLKSGPSAIRARRLTPSSGSPLFESTEGLLHQVGFIHQSHTPCKNPGFFPASGAPLVYNPPEL